MQRLNKKSVTLTETIVGSVILALVFGGLLVSFIAVRKYVLRANIRLVTANLSRGTLNDLYRAVRQDQWETVDTALYSLDTDWQDHTLVNPTIDNVTYTADYQVRRVAGHDYREARVNIAYPLD